MNKVSAWLIILSLIILASWLRLSMLGVVPTGLYWDEVAMLVDMKSVLATGLDMHSRPWYQVIYPSYGDFKLPVYIWLATISTKIFGFSAWSLRLPSAIAGVTTMLVAGATLYEALVSNKKTQPRLAVVSMLTTMMVLAFSPWSVLFSRTAFEGHVGQLLLAVSVYMLIISRRWYGWWLLSPIVGALATYSYFSVRFVWPFVFLSLAIVLWQRNSAISLRRLKPDWVDTALKAVLHFGFPMFLFAVLLLPMTKSPLYQDSNQFRLATDSVLKNEPEILQSNMYREMAGNTTIDRLVFHRWWLTLRELLLNYSDNISFNFLFTKGDPNLRHGTGEYGLFVWPLIPFFILGWWYLFTHYRGLFFVLGVWWLTALLPASVPENTPHALRTLNALVPLSMVIGAGLATSFDLWWRTRPTFRKITQIQLQWLLGTGLLSGILIAYIFVTASFIHYYFTIYPTQSAEDWQQGYTEVTQTILKLREGHPAYVETFDDRLYLWMMAFGPYTAKDFQSWPSYNYKFKVIDGVQFTNFPSWHNVKNGDTRVLVAGEVDAVNKVIIDHKARVVREEIIFDLRHQPRYKVILMDKLP